MATQPQAEPQNERAAVTLTKSEKDALRLVSIFDEVSESSLLRDHTVAQVVQRADEIRGRAGRSDADSDDDKVLKATSGDAAKQRRAV